MICTLQSKDRCEVIEEKYIVSENGNTQNCT